MGGRFFMKEIKQIKEIKPFLSLTGQIEKLRTRGCLIDDPAQAEAFLSQVSYYRFSAYLLPFKQKDGNYRPGTSFSTVRRIYEFDRRLRTILFAAVARIEVFLRSRFAHYHAEKYGPLGYMNSAAFRAKGHDHTRFIQKIQGEIKNNAKVPFVQHHIQNYNGQFPVWVIMELFTFGMLSRFYADLQTKDQKNLAKHLFGLNPKTFASWLHCCTDLRNNCAHHDRLYYRIFPSFPAGLANLEDKNKQRVFGMLLVLKALYPDKAEWQKEIYQAVSDLFIEYQSDMELWHIGFPQNWQELLKSSDNNFTRSFKDLEVSFTNNGFHSSTEVKYQNNVIYKEIISRPPLYFLPESFKALSGHDKEKYVDDFHAKILDFAELLKHEKAGFALGFYNILLNIEAELQKTIDNAEQSNTALPAYIQNMINKGLLYPDGKTTVKALVDIAYHLIAIEKMNITSEFLHKMFLKKDGKEFSIANCKSAIESARDRPAPKK
jgi:abortive infection bacteriophage resistance protein